MTPPTDHVRSYYAASVPPPPDRPALAGERKVDVCVVGAGFTFTEMGRQALKGVPGDWRLARVDH